MDRVYRFIVAVRAGSDVARYSDHVNVYNIHGYVDSCQIVGNKTRFEENPSNEPTLFGCVKSTKNEQYSSLFMVLLLAHSIKGYLSSSLFSLLPHIRGYRSSNRCFRYSAIASNS